LTQARTGGRPFSELLQQYATERFLLRLSRSQHAGHFVLKGALLLQTMGLGSTRPTMDIDLLGRLPNSPDDMAAAIKACLLTEVADDGIIFDPESVRAAPIALEAAYQGVRVRFIGYLGRARLHMQIDVGFGDVIVPGPVRVEFPLLFGGEGIMLDAYSRESAVAEKYHAMVTLGSVNSRMKDFFDCWLLAQTFDFDGPTLSNAIAATFNQRPTPVPTETPLALTPLFAADPTKRLQWNSFARRARMEPLATPALAQIVELLAEFLIPPSIAAAEGKSLPGAWDHGDLLWH
jgi:hypothetical protein